MLRRIVADKRAEVAARKQDNPRRKLERELNPGQFAFGKELRQRAWSLIAECKLASPAKGKLCVTHTAPQLAAIFSENGAAALSVHTSSHFEGELADIARVRAVSRLPILRKDFIIDEYQLYESRWAGADAVLLIAAILSDEDLSYFLATAGGLGMDSLVEVHSREELLRLRNVRAGIVGINNRDLHSFATDINNTFALLPYCDPEQIVISESGITAAAEAGRLKAAGVRGALVGEGLVRAPDMAGLTRRLAWPGGPEDGTLQAALEQRHE